MHLQPAKSALDVLPRLWCLNSSPGSLPGPDVDALKVTGVYLDTCLRQLAFGLAPCPVVTASSGDKTVGSSAYRALLEVATGLRSAVPGETNVGGQFRQATEHAASMLPAPLWLDLKPIVLALLADARTLRRTHLQGIAGQSYGSLVRALVAPRNDARVLFVGTGALTRSMLPLFSSTRIGVWNHRPSAPLGGISRWFAVDAAEAAAAWATDVVFTTPADPAHDQLWSERLGRNRQRAVVHLGLRRPQLRYRSAERTRTLDDVFDLASVRDQRRNQQLARAHQACADLVAQRFGRLDNPELPAVVARPIAFAAAGA